MAPGACATATLAIAVRVGFQVQVDRDRDGFLGDVDAPAVRRPLLRGEWAAASEHAGAPAELADTRFPRVPSLTRRTHFNANCQASCLPTTLLAPNCRFFFSLAER